MNSSQNDREQWYFLCDVGDLKPGQSRKFMLPIQGRDTECFAINFKGCLYAYVNRCRHVPMAMDWIDNQFFTPDGCYLMCQTHGALYEPETGECVAGPPTTCGKALFRVPVRVVDGKAYVTIPTEPIDSGL